MVDRIDEQSSWTDGAAATVASPPGRPGPGRSAAPPDGAIVRDFAIAVLGLLSAHDLGVVYPHEHLLTDPPAAIRESDPDLILDSPSQIVKDLRAFRAAGGRTVVELTTPDYGRDVVGLAQLSRDADVNIIATTGLNKARYSADMVGGRGIDDLASWFVSEIREGVASTGVRCGIAKLGTSLNVVHPSEDTVVRAVARTHLATGCPITTHTERGTLAEVQLDILESEGVPLSAVTIGHLDFCDDLDTLRRLAARGAFVEFDQVPKPKYGLEATIVERLTILVDEGLGTQLLVSGDFSRKSYFGHWKDGPGMQYLLTEFRDRLGSALAGRNHDADAVIEQIFVHNPRTALCFRAPASLSTAAAIGWP